MSPPLAFHIRPETPQDLPAIFALNAQAFESPAEAHLVDALRQQGALSLSLVAESEGHIIGHIAFSPVTIEAGPQRFDGMGLAPMAVSPHLQSQGIGSALVLAGLHHLRDQGHPFCVVLGHPDYYPRFGFTPSAAMGIHWEHEVPPEVFMIQALHPQGLAGVTGIVRYHPAFASV